MPPKKPYALKAPFLKRIYIESEKIQGWDDYPFSIPVFHHQDFEFEFTKPVTIIAGPNGSGKSTFTEAIAAKCGFSTSGGSQNTTTHEFQTETEHLSDCLRASWLPKISQGFFFRAETLMSFINSLDEMSREPMIGNSAYAGYGGESLRKNSHGESFIKIFENQFGRRGIYILDEPESALSPIRQIDLVKLIHRLEKSGDCQFIIATHSPLLMAYPNADLFCIEQDRFVKREFHEIDHFKLMRDFYLYPDAFITGILIEDNNDNEELPTAD